MVDGEGTVGAWPGAEVRAGPGTALPPSSELLGSLTGLGQSLGGASVTDGEMQGSATAPCLGGQWA